MGKKKKWVREARGFGVELGFLRTRGGVRKSDESKVEFAVHKGNPKAQKYDNLLFRRKA